MFSPTYFKQLSPPGRSWLTLGLLLFGLSAMAQSSDEPASTQNALQQAFATQNYPLAQRLFSPALQVLGVRLPHGSALQQFYQTRAYQPVWTPNHPSLASLTPEGQVLLQALRNAWQEGLNPADYDVSLLTLCLEGRYTQACDKLDLELLLTDSFVRYSTHLSRGRFDPKLLDSNWYLSQTTPWQPLDMLSEALQTNQFAVLLRSLAPPHPQYAALRGLLLKLITSQADDLWPLLPEEKLKADDQVPAVALLRQRLWRSGDLPLPASCEEVTNSDDFFDANLLSAVQRFQTRYGLVADGVIGPQTRAALNRSPESLVREVRLNMERWRWLPRSFGEHYLLVNIPGFELTVMANGQLQERMKVIVGKPERSTPAFAEQIRYLVLNPNWSVPHRIAVQDILPRLQKNRGYLSRQGLQVHYQGTVVDASQINWSHYNAKNFPYRFRQNPGEDNALGLIKFIFPNNFNIYLHDTPHRELFSKPQRAFSSGCVRVEKPLALAKHVLGSDPRGEQISDLLKTKASRVIYLPEPLPVYLLYFTVWVDESGQTQFREDIYARNHLLNNALGQFQYPHSPIAGLLLSELAVATH